ncbi:MAG: hypothetical protein HY202_00715 [Nitrospirae bacterium]|nr:hypothetical protein [Nitrospirota bacterium]
MLTVWLIVVIVHPYFQFPEAFIEIIKELCLKESGQKTEKEFIRAISPEVAKLSDLFNHRTPESAIASTLTSPHYPLAYLAYFLPSNFFKIACLLLDLFKIKELQPSGSRGDGDDEKRPLKVLDLGAGPGTSALGLLDFCSRFPLPFFEGREIDYLAVDQDHRQLYYSTLLFNQYYRHLEPSLAAKKISFNYQISLKKVQMKPVEGGAKFDFILAGNLFNEIKRAGHSTESLAGWAKGLIDQLTPDGFLLIIEPALRKTSRDLLSFRNLTASQKIASVIAPCLHQGPCPIMEPGGSEKDWCHQEREWIPPEWVNRMDEAIGNRKETLKYSFLILSPPTRLPVHPSIRWRAVSQPIVSKGKMEFFLCNEQGRRRFYRVNREKSEANACFSEISRGDLVEIEPSDGSNGTRIGPSWQIKTC